MSAYTNLKSCQIAHHTRTVGEGQDEYDDLPIRDETLDDGSNLMVSEWRLDEEQLEVLKNGGRIYLGIMGIVHPPVMILCGQRTTVEGVPNDDPSD